MKSDGGLNQLIYEYYEARILYGYYTCGDSLPSISKISSIFNMAPATIRSAMSMLEKKGYIKIGAGRAPQVIYRAKPSQIRENAARYFVPRRQGIADIMESGPILFKHLWKKGVSKWSGEDWKFLRHKLEEPGPESVPTPVTFYFLAFNCFDNGLLLNLFWDIIRYVCFPYLANREERPYEQLSMSKKTDDQIIELLQQRFDQKHWKAIEDLYAFIDEARAEYSLENAEQVPFHWTIYRPRPQLRYTLASLLIREMIEGHYPAGSYLPSLPQLAKRYGVGLSTVRRALELLNSLGVVVTFHGKGTQVCVNPLRIDYTRPEVQEGMRLYQESLELLALTVRQVLSYTLDSVPANGRNALIRRLEFYRTQGKSYVGFEVLLLFVEEECPSALIRECYRKLRELLVWGYSFDLPRLNELEFQAEYDTFSRSAEILLREGNIAAFTEKWGERLENEARRARVVITNHLTGN